MQLPIIDILRRMTRWSMRDGDYCTLCHDRSSIHYWTKVSSNLFQSLSSPYQPTTFSLSHDLDDKPISSLTDHQDMGRALWKSKINPRHFVKTLTLTSCEFIHLAKVFFWTSSRSSETMTEEIYWHTHVGDMPHFVTLRGKHNKRASKIVTSKLVWSMTRVRFLIMENNAPH